MAVRAAREKASAMAKELGAGIGKVMTISETSDWWWGDRNNGNNSNNNSGEANDGGQSPLMPLGQIALTATVNVVFELTDK